MTTTDKTLSGNAAGSGGLADAQLRRARLSPESRDPEARAMASSPELAALLDEARRSGSISDEEFRTRNPLTPKDEVEGEALLEEWLAEDEAAGVRDEPES